jgi:hypothetical protein
MTERDRFAQVWVEFRGHPPADGIDSALFTMARRFYDAGREPLLSLSERLKGDLIAAGEGHPVLVCPNCGAPTVDYDGMGLVACPRDPACYCTCLSSDDGVCSICGRKDSK